MAMPELPKRIKRCRASSDVWASRRTQPHPDRPRTPSAGWRRVLVTDAYGAKGRRSRRCVLPVHTDWQQPGRLRSAARLRLAAELRSRPCARASFASRGPPFGPAALLNTPKKRVKAEGPRAADASGMSKHIWIDSFCKVTSIGEVSADFDLF